MQKKLNILTGAYMLFILFLHLSAAFGGILSDVIYYLGFIIPFGVCVFMTRGEGVEWKRPVRISPEGAKLFAPLVFPTVFCVMSLSALTSFLLLTLTGKTNPVDLGDSYLLAVINHALIPAIFEEILFRYLPMRLIAPHSPRYAIIFSAIFFALVHQNLFSIPYAIFAGVLFMAINLATDSIIPSIVIHFINNLVSVSLLFISQEIGKYLFCLAVLILALISLIFIIKRRKEYERPLSLITDKGEGAKITMEMILFAAFTLAVAVLNLL
jgi:membrane protease YdiL (CAAX protease family)